MSTPKKTPENTPEAMSGITPKTGGTWFQDAKTGALTRDPGANAAPASPPGVAPQADSQETAQ